jgi:hypothetical protein
MPTSFQLATLPESSSCWMIEPTGLTKTDVKVYTARPRSEPQKARLRAGHPTFGVTERP